MNTPAIDILQAKTAAGPMFPTFGRFFRAAAPSSVGGAVVRGLEHGFTGLERGVDALAAGIERTRAGAHELAAMPVSQAAAPAIAAAKAAPGVLNRQVVTPMASAVKAWNNPPSPGAAAMAHYRALTAQKTP